MGKKAIEKEEIISCKIREFHDQKIEAARDVVIPLQVLQDLGELFKVLGDNTRLRILHALIPGEMCVCDIAATLEMGQSAVSHQLRVLRQARLVSFRKEGKVVWYFLNDDHVTTLLCQGMEHVSHR